MNPGSFVRLTIRDHSMHDNTLCRLEQHHVYINDNLVIHSLTDEAYWAETVDCLRSFSINNIN